MTQLSIVPVESRRQKKQFLDLPWQLYKGDPNWIPPLRMNVKELVGFSRHPFHDQNEVQPFLALKDGEPVGRVAAIVNRAHIDRYRDRRGFFGFFECVDDQQVADALFDTMRAWFADRDIQDMRGPTNPSLNYECGLLVDGFDTPPFFMMTFNRPYYGKLIEGYGFRKVQDMYAFWGHIDMLRQLKTSFPKVPVIAGNVATAQGVADLVEAGADAVKVGVGAGSICTTRIVTGFGVPQLTALDECARLGQELGVPVIADGGLRTSGDITKALAAGASTVMLGSLLAGTDESPGAALVRHGRRYKVVRGMASLTANVARKEIEKMGEVDPDEWEAIVPEGVEALVPHRGAVGDILYQLVGGLRSGMSYAGASTIEELWRNAEFIRITPAGQKESGSHDVSEI